MIYLVEIHYDTNLKIAELKVKGDYKNFLVFGHKNKTIEKKSQLKKSLWMSNLEWFYAGFLFLVPGWDGFRFSFYFQADVVGRKRSFKDSATSKIKNRQS